MTQSVNGSQVLGLLNIQVVKHWVIDLFMTSTADKLKSLRPSVWTDKAYWMDSWMSSRNNKKGSPVGLIQAFEMLLMLIHTVMHQFGTADATHMLHY